MALIDLLTFNDSAAAVVTPVGDENLITLRRGTTNNTALTHDDMDDNMSNISNQLNVTIGQLNAAWRSTEYDSEADDFVIKNETDAGVGLTIASGPTSRGNIFFADGTAATSVRYRGGITYDHDDDNLSLRTSGDERVWIDSAGKVGIGTPAPFGELELLSTNTDTNLIMGGTPTAGTREPWRIQAEGDNLYIGQNKSSFAKYMTFLGGSVGIGTNQPGKKLEIFNGGLKFGTNTAGLNEFELFPTDEGSNGLAVYDRTNTAYRMLISNDGNVGIGTTSPGANAKLVLQDTTNGWVGLGIRGSAVGSNTHYEDNDWVMYASRGSAPTDKHFFGIYNADANDGATTGYKFAVTKQGNVGVGTSQPAVSLHIDNTDAIILPVGTDVQRPTAAAGMLRFNSSGGEFEGHDGSAWGAIGGDVSDASATAKGIVELATLAETTAGTDTVRAVTPAGVQAAVNGILDGAPAALDTLNELAAAIGDDSSYASTITTALGLKAPLASPTFTGTIAIPGHADLEAAVSAAGGATVTTYGSTAVSTIDFTYSNGVLTITTT